MVLFLSVVLGNAQSSGAFDNPTIISDPTANFTISGNVSNISFTQNPEQFKPPTCDNLGEIPIISDVGCTLLLLLWLNGLSKMTTDWLWINYIWIIPLSIIITFVISKFIRGNS